MKKNNQLPQNPTGFRRMQNASTFTDLKLNISTSNFKNNKSVGQFSQLKTAHQLQLHFKFIFYAIGNSHLQRLFPRFFNQSIIDVKIFSLSFNCVSSSFSIPIPFILCAVLCKPFVMNYLIPNLGCSVCYAPVTYRYCGLIALCIKMHDKEISIWNEILQIQALHVTIIPVIIRVWRRVDSSFCTLSSYPRIMCICKFECKSDGYKEEESQNMCRL